jgi:hypothetical protein
MECWFHVRNLTLPGINRIQLDGPPVSLAIPVTVHYSDGPPGLGQVALGSRDSRLDSNLVLHRSHNALGGKRR